MSNQEKAKADSFDPKQHIVTQDHNNIVDTFKYQFKPITRFLWDQDQEILPVENSVNETRTTKNLPIDLDYEDYPCLSPDFYDSVRKGKI